MFAKKKKVEFSPWDGTEFLDTEEACAAYLAAELAEGDPHYIKVALETIARARNMSKTAKKARLPRATLYRAFANGGNPEYSTIQKIVDALDMRLVVVPKNAKVSIAV